MRRLPIATCMMLGRYMRTSSSFRAPFWKAKRNSPSTGATVATSLPSTTKSMPSTFPSSAAPNGIVPSLVPPAITARYRRCLGLSGLTIRQSSDISVPLVANSNTTPEVAAARSCLPMFEK